MNKFDRLERFIKSQIEEKGALAIAKEVEELMHKNGLTEGPTLVDIFKSARFSEEYYLNEDIAGFNLEAFVASHINMLDITRRNFTSCFAALAYSESFSANDDDYANASAEAA